MGKAVRTERWARVEDGEIAEIGPRPDSWVNPDGSTTAASADSKVSDNTLKAAGYLPVYVDGPQDGNVDTYVLEQKRVVEARSAVLEEERPDEPGPYDAIEKRLFDLEAWRQSAEGAEVQSLLVELRAQREEGRDILRRLRPMLAAAQSVLDGDVTKRKER